MEFFQQYNFTIDENSPEDQEVGIDPEMLGHIFENLLEENREKGAFYTPKEIVQYMCKESLIEYLENSFDDHIEIEYFIKKHRVSDNLRDSKNAELLNRRLDEIKVCDPAIGSGAFPIGMLQEIYKAKRFIYPHLNTSVPFDPALVKKNIIQNSIYGVDIEKGAVDIAQLRFWLSLVVEEIEPEPLPNLDYKIMQGDSLLEQYEGIDLGRMAFMDEPQVTMISDLFAGMAEEPKIDYEISEKDLNSIKNLVALYFEEENKEAKTKIHKRIDELVIEHIDKSLEFFENKLLIKIAEYEGNLEKKLTGLKEIKKKLYRDKSKEFKEITKLQKRRANISESRKRLLKFEKTDERPYFLWHLYFMDVFEQGGFDVVIGNPPYIQLQSEGIRKQVNDYANVGFDTFRRTGDIYCLFYEQGFNLLKKKGVLTYITSNKWMRGGYGKDLRDYFTTVNTKKIINLGPSVFYSATVDTNIYIGKKESFKNNVRGFIINKRDSIKRLKDDQLIPLPDVSTDAWVVLDEEELRINEIFEEVGTPLEEWDLKINFGIKTGYNTAFIIDQEKRDELVEKDPKSAEIIKPILRGREIERYQAEWGGNYVVATFPSLKLDIDDYPVVKEYLESFQPKLNQTGETFIDSDGKKKKSRKKTGNKWFETQDQIQFVDEFKKEKVIWKRIGSIMRFAYSPDEFFGLDSTCIATGEKIKYLTAVLNSKAGLYQLFKTSPQTGTGDQIISNQALEPFLAPYPVEEVEQKINNLVDIILFIKKWDKTEFDQIIEVLSAPTVSKVFEDLVDHMVYELYFEEHMKEKGINIIDLVDFPTLAEYESKEEKKDVVRQLHQRLRKKDDEIRNRMLLAFTRSPNIIKKINDTVVK
ncbi:MAG: N-6 DNA methylase [Balneolaceae bacterium]|nr:N-6 DNA methylase [Balneolaceae bacterium]